MREFLPLLVTAALSSCAFFFPNSAPFLTNRETLAETPLGGNGILAFAPVGRVGVGIDLDILNTDSNRVFRVWMNPNFQHIPFGTTTDDIIPDSIRYRDVISRNVAFYALPPGRYLPKYRSYYTGKSRQINPMDADTFSIQRGKITSLGFLQVTFLSDLWIEPVGSDIDTMIRHASDTTLARMEILRARLVLDKTRRAP